MDEGRGGEGERGGAGRKVYGTRRIIASSVINRGRLRLVGLDEYLRGRRERESACMGYRAFSAERWR